MKFIETRGFTSAVARVFASDDDYRALQNAVLQNPKAGKVIRGTGGIRKLRWADTTRGKGRRGGLRVVYFHHEKDGELWMLALYTKDEMDDLTPAEKKALSAFIKTIEEA